MNVEYYRNFIAIIDEGSMSAAAQKLHIAQPALSNQLKVLGIKSGDFQKIIKLKTVKSLVAQGFFLFVQFYLYDLIFS